MSPYLSGILAKAIALSAFTIHHLPFASADAPAPAPAPNIVFLLADDMGYGDLGCYGSPVIQSPRLDRLAGEGIRLTECYAASSNCSPSRAAILTGRHPYRVGMYDFARFKPLQIPTSETTVAELLKGAGYDTLFAGKWHCSGDFYSGEQPYPGDHGFDHWLAHYGNFGEDPDGFLRNGDTLEPIEGWMSEIVVDEAMTWLDGRSPDSVPFFLCLWFSEPHTPVIAADEFKALYPEELTAPHLEAISKGGGPQVARRSEMDDPARYFGCVSMLDHHIGRLLDYLDSKGLSEDTLIVFTSDNGPEHRNPYSFGSPGILRGAKGHMHEGGIRVPGIVRWPGKIEAGSESDTPINGTDWLTTFSSIAGVQTPQDRPIDGANVLPALIRDESIVREEPLFWWLWHARGGYEAVLREGDYKLLATLTPQQAPGAPADTKQPEDWSIMEFIRKADLSRFALYNLKEDPSETKDLARIEPVRLQELKRKMIAQHAEIRVEGPHVDMVSRARN